MKTENGFRLRKWKKNVKEREQSDKKTIQPRMPNPTTLIPDALEPVKALFGASFKDGVPPKTLALVHLRALFMTGFQCIQLRY
ncbi:MAG TPA: hypothetical protein VGY56_12805 [Verrucomicrobiae bacterium]|nr:hypothetical protein [Verrucomicrobiae bacterium]